MTAVDVKATLLERVCIHMPWAYTAAIASASDSIIAIDAYALTALPALARRISGTQLAGRGCSKVSCNCSTAGSAAVLTARAILLLLRQLLRLIEVLPQCLALAVRPAALRSLRRAVRRGLGRRLRHHQLAQSTSRKKTTA